MTRKEKQHVYILGGIGVVFIFLILFIFLFYSNTDNSTQQVYLPSNQGIEKSGSDTFYSKNLHFSISLSSKYQAIEEYNLVTLKYLDYKILIDRIGTNFELLQDYLINLEQMNKLSFIDKAQSTINGLDAVSLIVRHPLSHSPDEKTYFIYTHNRVYSISTSSEALYADLDQIAQSFKYTP